MPGAATWTLHNGFSVARQTLPSRYHPFVSVCIAVRHIQGRITFDSRVWANQTHSKPFQSGVIQKVSVAEILARFRRLGQFKKEHLILRVHRMHNETPISSSRLRVATYIHRDSTLMLRLIRSLQTNPTPVPTQPSSRPRSASTGSST